MSALLAYIIDSAIMQQIAQRSTTRAALRAIFPKNA
jgi:hypothetical protein